MDSTQPAPSTLPSAALAQRREQAAERIYEDEALTGGLSDTAARALVDWAVAQVCAAAENPAISEAQFSAYGSAVQAAARAAARSGVADPATLLARAAAHLAAADPGRLVHPDHPQARGKPDRAADLAPRVAPAARAELLSWEERWRRWLRKEG